MLHLISVVISLTSIIFITEPVFDRRYKSAPDVSCLNKRYNHLIQWQRRTVLLTFSVTRNIMNRIKFLLKKSPSVLWNSPPDLSFWFPFKTFCSNQNLSILPFVTTYFIFSRRRRSFFVVCDELYCSTSYYAHLFVDLCRSPYLRHMCSVPHWWRVSFRCSLVPAPNICFETGRYWDIQQLQFLAPATSFTRWSRKWTCSM